MVNIGGVGPRRPVPVGAMADDLDLVVHALERAVAHAQFRPDEYPVEMGPQHPGEFLERHEATVAGAPEPLQKVPARPGRTAVGPEAAQILFER